MFKHRIIFVIALLMFVIGTIAVSRSSDVATTEYADVTDFFQRHPQWPITRDMQSVVIPVTGNTQLSDYFLRHPELRTTYSPAVEFSDYFQRHPELRNK